jgi:hypothetical protein
MLLVAVHGPSADENPFVVLSRSEFVPEIGGARGTPLTDCGQPRPFRSLDEVSGGAKP